MNEVAKMVFWVGRPPVRSSTFATLSAMPNEDSPDYYNFIAECPYCKESRGVSCSRTQAATGEPIEVYAIQCDHAWRLTPEDSRKLRENIIR